MVAVLQWTSMEVVLLKGKYGKTLNHYASSPIIYIRENYLFFKMFSVCTNYIRLHYLILHVGEIRLNLQNRSVLP